MSNVVKFFHGDMVGAPTLYGNAGGLISVLDACLKDGFGLQTLSSLVVAGGIATATFGSTPSCEVASVLLIAGATPSGLNGEKKVLSVTGNTATFDATGISDQTASGTITAKMAPLGWTKLFSGTNLAAYTSPAAGYSGMVLRVDDTGTRNARVVGYEAMYDINNGVNPYPTAAQQAGGLYWGKSSVADANWRKWMVWGDDKGFYFWAAPYNQGASYIFSGQSQYFGDLIARNTSDKYATVLTGQVADRTSNGSVIYDDLGTSYIASAYGGVYVPRPVTQLGGPISMLKACTLASASGYSGLGMSSVTLAYPNGGDNALFLAPVWIFGGTGNTQRGFLPGFYQSDQQCYLYFNHRDVVPGTDDLLNKRLLALRHSPATDTGSTYGYCFIDVTGPWR